METHQPMDIDPPPFNRLIKPLPIRSSNPRSLSLPPQTLLVKKPPPRTGYVYDGMMMNHQHTAEDHPEKPERILTIFQLMQSEGLVKRMVRLPVVPVRRNRAMLVHSEDHWDKVEQIACMCSRYFCIVFT